MHYHPARAAFFAALLVAASSYPAKAVTFSIDSVIGIWTEASPAPAVSGLNTNQISWGKAATNNGKSSYTFQGAAPPSKVFNLGDNFTLGTFTHRNYPIYGNSLTEATLNITIKGSAEGVGGTTTFEVSSLFEFTHIETPNNGYNCCKDKVTAVINEGGSEAFSVDGENYIFNFSGFLLDLDDLLPFSVFETKEDKKNKAFLVGSFQEVPGGSGDVPLPAALPLFASILAGGGLIAWRRKRKGNQAGA